MVHHIQRKFDTGAIMFAMENNTPIDLSKSMWENYCNAVEMIVEGILATAAAYKLGLDTDGVRQDLSKPVYHSYPGPDSRPPSYFTPEERQAIKEEALTALPEFLNAHGRISDPDFFVASMVKGIPAQGIPGFVVSKSQDAGQLESAIRGAQTSFNMLRPNGNNGGGNDVTVAEVTLPEKQPMPQRGDQQQQMQGPPPEEAANDHLRHG